MGKPKLQVTLAPHPPHSQAPVPSQGAYLRSVKRTVSSLWEATITLALVLCCTSSRM